MKRLLLTLLAALLGLLTACGVSSAGTTVPLAQIQGSGVSTDGFGLRLDLSPSWVGSEESTKDKLVLLYRPSGAVCGQNDCSRLTLALPTSAYYQMGVQATFLMECRAGGNKYGPSVKQPGGFHVGGVLAEYYINDPCVKLSGVQQPRRFAWYLPDELLLVFDEMPRGANLDDTGLESALASAVRS
jgi:hypothetical protein